MSKTIKTLSIVEVMTLFNSEAKAVAWFLSQRIRAACKPNGFMLADLVDIDETYIGGKETNKHDGKKLKAGRAAVGRRLWVCGSGAVKD